MASAAIRFHPAAGREAEAAYNWYAARNPSVAHGFREELRHARSLLDSYLERDLTKQRPWHLDSSLARAATRLQLHEAVFVENTQVILDVLEISTNDLGELVD